MSKVTIRPTSTGELITVYPSNPNYGYIAVETTDIYIANQQAVKKSRVALVRGEVEVLKAYVSMLAGKPLPGHIIVKEFLEDDLPASYESRLNKKAISREAAIEPFIKRAGKGGIALTLGGQRILRFTEYDATGSDTDVIVSYDNVAEVYEARSAAKSAVGAILPGTAEAAF